MLGCSRFIFWLFALKVGLKTEAFPSTAQLSNEPFPWKEFRLPTTVRPDHYIIQIYPNLQTKSFSGQVFIFLTALKQTDTIVLNSKSLVISEASLKLLSKQQEMVSQLELSAHQVQQKRQDPPELTAPFVKQLTLHPAHKITPGESLPKNIPSHLTSVQNISMHIVESHSLEQLAVVSRTPLKAGHKYQLSLSFHGYFSQTMSGLYESSYQMPDGTQRTIVVTHFEPSSARKAFPCFDEPRMKAKFSLNIVRKNELTSLSNMPLVSTTPCPNGLAIDHYETSVNMSTYLVAFMVGDYASNSATTNRGLKVSVHAASHQINHTKHALQEAVKILEFYEQYFQISYPLPKLDLVAVPDFDAGAMENWGLLMFRETTILCDNNPAHLNQQFTTSLVIAHEITHQWFGNLVTPRWWNELWLNEGLASYLEYISLLHLQPQWHVEQQQMLSTLRALEEDSLEATHPVSRKADTPTQMREMFDVISYSKGASVMRMLHTYILDSVFRDGMRVYLRRHSYGNAQGDDLWKAMTEVSQLSGRGLDIKSVMDPWIRQIGYPIVSVRIQGTKLHLRQEAFTKQTRQTQTNSSLWHIPVCFHTNMSFSVITHLFKTREDIVELPQPVSWVKVNVGSTGFYRVWYDRPILEALYKQLQEDHSKLSLIDRAGLIDDIFHLAGQETLLYSDALVFSQYMMREDDYLPISVFLKHMYKMISKFTFANQQCAAHLLKEHTWQVLKRQVLAERWAEAGCLPGQSRRALLLELAVRSSPSAQRTALRLFYFWMAQKKQLPWSIGPLVWRVGVWRGGPVEWAFLLRQHQASNSSAERMAMLTALCHTTSPSRINWLLKAALQGHVIKSHDFVLVVAQLSSRVESCELVWRFLQEHWDQIEARFPLGSSNLAKIVTHVTSHFNSTEKYDEVLDFFVRKRNIGHFHFVQQSLELIQMNINWLVINIQPIKAWLQKQYPVTFKTCPHCRKEVMYRFRWGATIHIRI